PRDPVSFTPSELLDFIYRLFSHRISPAAPEWIAAASRPNRRATRWPPALMGLHVVTHVTRGTIQAPAIHHFSISSTFHVELEAFWRRQAASRNPERARELLHQQLETAKIISSSLRKTHMAEATMQKTTPPPPLTALSEDEQMFRDNIKQFADEKVRPLVREMDEKQVFDAGLIKE